MRSNAPAQITFINSLVLAAAAVLSRFAAIQTVPGNAFWILLISYFVLVSGGVHRRR